MAKLDFTNAYRSICLLAGWRHGFVVCGCVCRRRYTRLPFGRKYSPAICQRLVKALVQSAMQGLPAVTNVYLNDILVYQPDPQRVCVALGRIVNKLKAIWFLISQRSPTRKGALPDQGRDNHCT